MRDLKQFKLNLINLKPGKYDYDFTADSEFFTHFPNSLVSEVNSNIKVALEKQSDVLYILNFKGEGKFNLECDRCLDEITLPFTFEERLMVRVSDHPNLIASDDEDLLVLAPDSNELDLSTIIYEYIHVQIPLRKTCEDISKECDQEMLTKINQYIIGSGDTSPDIESEENSPSDTKEIDPRWVKLKGLLGDEEK